MLFLTNVLDASGSFKGIFIKIVAVSYNNSTFVNIYINKFNACNVFSFGNDGIGSSLVSNSYIELRLWHGKSPYQYALHLDVEKTTSNIGGMWLGKLQVE